MQKSVTSLAATIADSLEQAVATSLDEAITFDPEIRRSDFADFQADSVMSLARWKGLNPRELATRIVSNLDRGTVLGDFQVAGPGFINFTVRDEAILAQLYARRSDARLGCGTSATPLTIVVDYSQPNIAKEMHVGHLRSTIIGDALARLLGFRGHHVVRQNHVGDWGTQFGMLIQHVIENGRQRSQDYGSTDISALNELYQEARKRFDADDEFAERARNRVVLLQSGDDTTLRAWREIVNQSKRYFNEVYEKLDVSLDDGDVVGESFYNSMLSDVASDMESRGIAQRSNGALCVFFEDIRGPDNSQIPLIVQKADGGFGYAAADLAAIRYRVRQLAANKILYVVDARQSLHFKMVFEAARRAGYLPDGVEATHVSFGSVLGSDGRPLKTRAGDAVRLIDLLDGAISRSSETIRDRGGNLDQPQLEELARAVGIGAVKYADLSTSRTRDYRFDLDRMLSLQGNTGVYLQYAYARIQSILRRAGGSGEELPPTSEAVTLVPAERELVLLLDDMDSVLRAVEDSYEPHRLCNYLYSLAQAFTAFYEQCSVLKAPTPYVRAYRLAMCELTARTLHLGLDLLGIRTPERL